MKVTISNRLARKLKPVLEDRKADPEVQLLLDQINRARTRDQNLDLDELEALEEILSEGDCVVPRMGSGRIWPEHTRVLVTSARAKLAAMKKKILDYTGAVDPS